MDDSEIEKLKELHPTLEFVKLERILRQKPTETSVHTSEYSVNVSQTWVFDKLKN